MHMVHTQIKIKTGGDCYKGIVVKKNMIHCENPWIRLPVPTLNWGSETPKTVPTVHSLLYDDNSYHVSLFFILDAKGFIQSRQYVLRENRQKSCVRENDQDQSLKEPQNTRSKCQTGSHVPN